MTAATIKKNSALRDLDLRAPAFAKNPYSTYALLRAQHPVLQIADGTYILSRYEDVKLALKNYELFASGWAGAPIAHPKWLREDYRRGHFLPETDPPEHTQNSAIINKSFVGKAIDTMLPFMRETAVHLAPRLRRADADFLTDFAFPYMGSVLANITGMDTGHDMDRTREWIELAESFTEIEPAPELQARAENIILEQNEYYDELIRDRRKSPRNDVVSLLANSTVALNAKQLRGALNLFTLGGVDSPSQLLANAIVVLARHPELVESIRSDNEHIRAFVEELLRYNNPAQGAMRVTTQPIALHNVAIPPNATILALIGSANRDYAQFPNADEFILFRPNIKTHVGLGHGVHACIGSVLARTELKIALEVLLQSFTHFECPADNDLDWASTAVGRLLRRMPVKFH